MSMIRRVPESMKTDVDAAAAYIPFLVGMGPYHHFHPQLYKLEGVKLAAARSGLRRFNIPDLPSFLRELRPLIPRIRACYDGATVSAGLYSPELDWAIAVDGLFLLSLLCDGEHLLRLVASAGTAFLLPARRKLTVARRLLLVVDDFRNSLRRPVLLPPPPTDEHGPPATFSQLHLLSAVLYDAVLLENQVPISILAEAVAQFRPDVHQLLADHLHSLFTLISPVQLAAAARFSGARLDAAHLLEYLYLRIIATGDCDPPGTDDHHQEVDLVHSDSIAVAVQDGGVLDETTHRFYPYYALYKLCARKVAGTLFTVGKLSAFGLLDYFIPGTPRNEARSNPTAAQLARIGVRFEPKSSTCRGCTTTAAIEFNEEARTITVPVFRWHPYSNVLTRNLLAYEAASCSSSDRASLFADYTHFLHAVAGTRRDVELLIEAGVVEITTGREQLDDDTAGSLARFFRSLRIENHEAAGGGNSSAAAPYDAVKRYYNSRPRVVARGGFVRLAYVSGLAVLYSVEAIAVFFTVFSILCGMLKNFTGCTVGGDEGTSCTGNVTTALMSVVQGRSGTHRDA